MALNSLGFITVVHPAAMAAANLTQIEPTLEFQGVKMTETPKGSSTTFDFPTVLTKSKSFSVSLKYKKVSAPNLLDQSALCTVAPYSAIVASFKSSTRFVTAS